MITFFKKFKIRQLFFYFFHKKKFGVIKRKGNLRINYLREIFCNKKSSLTYCIPNKDKTHINPFELRKMVFNYKILYFD